MCSTKPKFITLLYFIFIIAYKLLVHFDLEWLWLSLTRNVTTSSSKAGQCLWNNHLQLAVQLFNFLIALDSIHPVAATGPTFHWIFHPHIWEEEVSEKQTTKHHAMSSKLKLFPPCNRLHTIPCSHLMSFGLKPRTTTNKICSSCQIFFKAFLETVNYAGFCGILNTTQTQNLLQ